MSRKFRPEPLAVRTIKDRTFETIPVDEIEVINPRSRDEELFDRSANSIRDRGMLKPILVNAQYRDEHGKYELVCGEGRLLAAKRMGQTSILAEVIRCERGQALLTGLVENLARVPPHSLWYAREVKRLYDHGVSCAELAKILGRSTSFVLNYIHLIRDGEEFLLEGVEQGSIPITVAIMAVGTGNEKMQQIFIEAYDKKLISSKDFGRVRKIIKARRAKGAQGNTVLNDEGAYDLRMFAQDMNRVAHERSIFVKESLQREKQLMQAISLIGQLRSDPEFMCLVQDQGLGQLPVLEGGYAGPVNRQQPASASTTDQSSDPSQVDPPKAARRKPSRPRKKTAPSKSSGDAHE